MDEHTCIVFIPARLAKAYPKFYMALDAHVDDPDLGSRKGT